MVVTGWKIFRAGTSCICAAIAVEQCSPAANGHRYYLKAKQGQVEMVLWFLVEGVDMAVMVRYEALREPVPGFKRKYPPRTPPWPWT
jgi:hypothetical protein